LSLLTFLKERIVDDFQYCFLPRSNLTDKVRLRMHTEEGGRLFFGNYLGGSAGAGSSDVEKLERYLTLIFDIKDGFDLTIIDADLTPVVTF